MTKKYIYAALALSMGLTVTSFAATELLTTGENVIAVGGQLVNNSDYPNAEYPGCIVDQNVSTKYLNFQGISSGFVVVPTYGPTVLKSFQMSTANDAEERDPASYRIFGSNDEITLDDLAVMNNSAGNQNNWTLIAEGTLSLPSERKTLGDIIPVTNDTSYTAYKVIFPTLKDNGALMQVADIQFYEVESPDPDMDYGFLSAADMDYTVAVADAVATNSSYATDDWDTSKPTKISNGNLEDRYANFAIKDVGVAIWPAVGMTKLESFQLCTFTNLACCDPIGYKIYGTEDYQLSADNSLGDKENWVLLSEGALNMPLARTTWCDKVDVNATEFYRGYKLLFTGIRDESDPEATVVHVAEMQFFGTKQAKDLGDAIMRPGDLVRPIDPEGGDWFVTNIVSNSRYPGQDATYGSEGPSNALDGDVNTKYLNYDVNNPGFIVTPKAGKTTVKSIRFWTANDSPDRDPTSWVLYGTDEAIVSTDNSTGLEENWTLIDSGNVDLPADRKVEGPLVAVNNDTAYTSYKLLFPTLKNAGEGHMQIADTLFYKDTEGTSPIFQEGEIGLAVSYGESVWSRMGYSESTQHAIDGNTGTKYYVRNGKGSGIILIPTASSSIVTAMTITTANDAEQRDPTSYILYGTTDTVKSADFTNGDKENWSKIAEGELNLPAGRKTIIEEPIEFDNASAYSAYKVVFPTIKSEDPTSGMQFSEIQLYGKVLEAAPANLINYPRDFFIAVSTDVRPSSEHADYESAAMLIDNVYGPDEATKYYNKACWTNNIGFIVTPSVTKELQFIEFCTANDYAERDPSSYKLYGTNDEITSVDNGSGNEENWTLIKEGTLNFTDDRNTQTEQITLDSAVTYSSYKMIFPTRKSDDVTTTDKYQLGIQVSEIFMYSSAYERITDPADFIIAVADYQSGSNYPAQEPPYAVADGDIKVKYLNRGGPKSGFIVTPAVQVTPTAVMYTRANDSADRDPLTVEIYGTNDPIIDLDNSAGDKENWILVGSGTFEASDFRFRNSNIIYFTNTDAFSSYRVIFPTLRGTGLMQVGEFYFFDLSEPEPPTPVTFDFEGDVNYSGSANGSITAGTVEGSYTVKGSGADVWGDNDQFFYAAKKVEGDFDYTVCVESFDGSSNAWAKAGIMVREANADDNQIGNARRFALQVQTETGKGSSSTDYWASYRDAVGASVGDGQCVHNGPFVFPHLQRIAYVDGVVYGMISEDQGETWNVLTVIDTNTWADGRLGAELPLYIGMWVTSHEANSNDATAEFSGVTLVKDIVPMDIVIDPVAELSVEEGSIFGPSSFGTIAFGTDAEFVWTKNGTAVSNADIETYYASSKIAGTYQLQGRQGDEIIVSSECNVSVDPSTNPGKVQVWIYDSPNPGSLAAVETAFNNFRVADQVYYMTDYLEIPADRADYYGSAFIGLLTPEETGAYYFYVASDDDSAFYLSTDDTPENLTLIGGIHSGDWTNSREYTKYDYQKSGPVNLEAGKSYLFVGMHNEGSGGDNFSVAWVTPNTDVVPTTPIPAKYLSQYGVPNEKELTLSYSIEGDELVLRWAAESGANLEVAPTADSTSWTLLRAEFVGGAYQCRVPMNEAAGFYRLVAE